MTHDIRKLLNIKDPHIHFYDNCVEKLNNKHYIKCSLTYPIHTCPCCHSEGTVVKNGTRTSKITYLESFGQPCYLLLKKQRYLGRHCHQTYTAETNLVEKHCFISRATQQKIASLATDTTSEKKIASQTHVSIHTVRRVVDAFASTVRKRLTSLPEHLCFDELSRHAL